MGLSTAFSLVLLVNAFCLPAVGESAAAGTKKLDAKQIEKLIYDRLRKQHAFKCHEIPYEIYVKRVEGKKLHGVAFFRRDKKDTGYDEIGFASQMALQVDLINRQLRVIADHCHWQISNGSYCYRRFITWNIDLPTNLHFAQEIPKNRPMPSAGALKRLAKFERDIKKDEIRRKCQKEFWELAFGKDAPEQNYPLKIHIRRNGLFMAVGDMKFVMGRMKLLDLEIAQLAKGRNGKHFVQCRISSKYAYITCLSFFELANRDDLEFELPDGTKLKFSNR